jgi:hypothetical protein
MSAAFQRADLANALDQVEQFAGRAAKTVELGHRHHVARLEGGTQRDADDDLWLN